jgi:hypothetical protein
VLRQLSKSTVEIHYFQSKDANKINLSSIIIRSRLVKTIIEYGRDIFVSSWDNSWVVLVPTDSGYSWDVNMVLTSKNRVIM